MTNDTQEAKKEKKPKRRTIGSIILFNSVVLLVFSYNDGIKGLQESYEKYFKPSINLTLTPTSGVKVGDSLMLNYEAPSEGYMSLWNWNGAGEIKVMEQSFSLSISNNKGSYELVPTHVGMEHVILLWTEKASMQIDDTSIYSDASFNSTLKLRGKDIHRVDVRTQINNW